MSTLELIELIVIAALIVSLTIFYLIKAIKNKWLSKITEAILKAMKEAEQSGMSGSEKKAYVLKKVEELCIELGIPYSFIKSLIDRFIEKTIKSYNSMIK